jgi:hypothetical protein
LKVSVGIQDVIQVDVANLTAKKYSQNVTKKDQVSINHIYMHLGAAALNLIQGYLIDMRLLYSTCACA